MNHQGKRRTRAKGRGMEVSQCPGCGCEAFRILYEGQSPEGAAIFAECTACWAIELVEYLEVECA